MTQVNRLKNIFDPTKSDFSFNSFGTFSMVPVYIVLSKLKPCHTSVMGAEMN